MKGNVKEVASYGTYGDIGYGYRLYSLEEGIKEERYYYCVCILGNDNKYYTPAGRELRGGAVAELGPAWEGNNHFVRSMFFGVGLCGCDIWLVEENRNELQYAEPVFYDYQQALDYAHDFIHRRKPVYMNLRKIMELSKEHIEHFINMPGNFLFKSDIRAMKLKINIATVKISAWRPHERIIEWQSQQQVNNIIPVVMATMFSSVEKKDNGNSIRII